MEDPEGTIYEQVFEPYDGKTAGARMQKYIQDNPLHTVLEKQKVVYPEPEGYSHEAVRTQLYSIEKECRAHYQVDDFESVAIILSGPGNYRTALATVFPYKGNRDPEHKPHWYQSIRNYLTGEWGACVVHGREADDECSIRARQLGGNFVVATIDKDLDQIPGEHYNYLKQVFYAQSPLDAAIFFWQQCLSGDATDGIPGCFRIGEQRAASIIAELSAATVQRADVRKHRTADRSKHSAADAGARGIPANVCAGMGIPANVWAGIVEQYRLSQSRNGCPYVESDPEVVALETARLVYLQQEEGELWIPTGPPHDRLESYRDE